ncbi:MAG: chorismate-binding protein, partial [Vicinamibacteria bacterium]|nr:chorismate-binding protein [Vicinamibacteria bacterium]
MVDEMRAVVRAGRRFLLFEGLEEIVACASPRDVPAGLECLERAYREGKYLVGYVAYEAARAMDLATHAVAPDTPPLLCWGVFSALRVLREAPWPRRDYFLAGPRIDLGPARYADKIACIQEHLAAGDSYQVNFTFPLSFSFTGDAWSCFLDLAGRQPAAQAAFIDLGRQAVLSVSPELFFRRSGTRLCARPMKGTIARGCDEADDARQADRLRASLKDRAENVMIVDMLRNDLGRIASFGSVHVERLFDVERHP